ncbi:TraB/GumN family protein [Chitinibacter sp. S2-10]|uniref:TraB/GumN family protein n=1 Tax=Chitinibacter sp. S2-10 TaxID=3373597 RepID=UPI0039773289
MFARLSSAIAVVLSAALLFACSANAEKPANTKAVLWKIENTKSAPSWVLATVNTPDGHNVEFKPEVEPALQQSKYIGTEYYNDMNSSIQLAQAMLSKEPGLKAALGDERYGKLLPLLAARGYPEKVAAKLQSWAAVMLLFTPAQGKDSDGKENIPMDEYVFQYATETNKPYFAIESIEQQLAPFQKIPVNHQLALIDGMIGNQPALQAAHKENMQAYLASDIEPIAPMAQIEKIALPKTEQAWFNTWRTEFKNQRNKVIVERLKPALSKGEVFFTVGADQLSGSDGLLVALRAAGYTVSPVQAGKAEAK